MNSIPPDDDRSAGAVAHGAAWRAITIAIEMVLPGVIGLGIDRLLGLRALFVLLGFGGGMVLGVWQLVRLARKEPKA